MTGATKGKRGVRAAVQAAQPAASGNAAGGTAGTGAAASGTQPGRPAAAGAASASPMQSAAPGYLASRFEMRPAGLFRKNQDETTTWICGAFTIEAETRDDEGRGWGLLISWHDRDGVKHEEAFSRALFTGECGDVRARLADAGLSLNAAQAARQAFAEYLNVAASQGRARSVAKIGWHEVIGHHVFVLPGQTYGATSERVVLQTADAERSLFNEAGTLAQWQSGIGRLCIGNSRLAFAASCAFAAPLLGLVGEEGGGFNYRGPSRTGKSTALHVAASVCGGTASSGAGGFVRAWRATGNGIEGVAAGHNDCLLPLDEMGQVDGREVGEIAYMLSNGQGKARAWRTGLARAALRFRTLFLSTGEIGLAEKNAEGGRATRAGMEVRCCDIPANAGAGHGLFEELHGEIDADAFARELKQQARQLYGTPLRAFLSRLIADLHRDPVGYADGLRARAADLARQFLASRPGATGQVRSVAGRFALVALGGEMASAWHLTEWPEGEATAAAARCFAAWLAERGTEGAREDAQAAMQLRAFIARHGASRFDDWKDAAPQPAEQQDIAVGQAAPQERFRTGNRAGWRRWIKREDGGWQWRYLLTAEGMREAMTGLAPREATRTLADMGLIVLPLPTKEVARGVLSGLHHVPGTGKVRLYQVADDVLKDSDEAPGGG